MLQMVTLKRDGMATARQSLASGSRSQHAPNGPPDPPEGPHLAQASCPTHQENQPPPHLRPFFYVQPSQSYIPYQWPVPVPYNPYCGLPSFGYNMIMPPNLYGFPPNPYMEAPAYIIPHAQLHLADYRRMLNPQFPPAVAYHARRFRCQHVMVPRETVSSEVQTEPLLQETSNSQLSCSSASCSAETHSMGSDSGKGSGCTNASSSQGSESSTHPGKAESLDVDADLMSTPPQASATPKGAYMFQWDHVQMSAEGSSLDSKAVPSSESVAESAQDSSGLLAQCDDSISSSKVVIPLFSSSANDNTTTGQGVACDSGKTEQQCLPSYPDILLVSGSPSSGTDLRLKAVHNGGCETSVEQMATNKVTELEKVDGEVAEHASTLKEPCFKIVRLPFEMHYLEEVQKVEESVWSVEPLVPCVPSVEWMVQHEFSEAEKVKTAAPEGLNLNRTPTSPLDSCLATPLSPYLPSASWLADFGNVYYYSKMPPSMQAHLSNFSSSSEPPAVREKPTRDLRGHSTGGRTKKCMHVNLKNHLGQSLGNVSSTADKGERNCPRCQAKADVPPGVNLKAPSRSHKVTHSSTGDLKSQTRISCRCCVGKVLRKGRSPNVSSRNRDEEMENSAPSAMPRQPGSEGKRSVETGGLAPLRRHSEKCSVKCSKLQEKNCACKEHSGPPVDEGNWWRHADGVRDNEENVALSSLALDKCGTPERRRAARRLQADASWRGTAAVMSDKESEIAARRRTQTKPKKQCTHSQEKLHLSKTTALMTHKSKSAEDYSSTRINTGSYT
ncbi:bucky ball-like [Brienomyrus brachyistius]|uniref:bucky ball-like n=1 Tax=Brienomyrus brachyistius TaxID=42636 RepID=UPI0020B37716|nr:bucky ball-like [Brienomyrus brachyistius]